MNEEQPIDLDDLRRVAVKVRWMTDDNWLADMVEIAAAEIARLREERRWVPVGERLPEHPCWVIAFDAKQQLVIYVHFSFDDYHDGPVWENDRGRRNPTHWMPLPPGPEGDG
jgi:hypothetical protein